jgi:PHD/YefM family antitoxin component YafN of YafNO toxin-antitoxin module
MKLSIQPQLVYRDGQPSAVILDIPTFEAMLDAIEDLEDIESLQQAIREPMDRDALDTYIQQVRNDNEQEGRRAVLPGADHAAGEAAA